jgi:hypothetical protein
MDIPTYPARPFTFKEERMSKQSEAKKKQNYNPKPEYAICSNCDNYAGEVVKKQGTFGSWKEEINKFCKIGEFAVKKQGTCTEHKFITEPV